MLFDKVNCPGLFTEPMIRTVIVAGDKLEEEISNNSFLFIDVAFSMVIISPSNNGGFAFDHL